MTEYKQWLLGALLLTTAMALGATVSPAGDNAEPVAPAAAHSAPAAAAGDASRAP